jgi:SAM-dependent methyltransferase
LNAAQQATSTPSYDDLWKGVYGDMQDHGPTHRHMRRLLGRLLDGLEYRSALEIGCGAGHNFELLGAARVTGVDVSEEALLRARERVPEAKLKRLDIQDGRLEGSWDLVFSSLVLEHLPDDVAALENMRAMTGRWLVVTTIAGDFERYRPWEEQMGHVRNYRRGELEGKLEAAGFVPERVIYWGFPFYSPLARRLQNRMRSTAGYGLSTRIVARLMHALYYFNSSRRGDLLIALARPLLGEPATARSESSREHLGE